MSQWNTPTQTFTELSPPLHKFVVCQVVAGTIMDVRRARECDEVVVRLNAYLEITWPSFENFG